MLVVCEHSGDRYDVSLWKNREQEGLDWGMEEIRALL